MIRLSRSVLSPSEAEAVSRVLLDDGYLGMGNEVRLFEQEIAQYLGIDAGNVACISSGTAALHLAVQGVTMPGDEVLVQSLTFVSSFQAISAAGAVPVPCEVYPNDFTIDLEDAEARITPKTKAIMPVHYASYPGNLDRIYRFADRHGLRVIEDAAHAFGCTYQGRLIGSFGDIICFSFDGIKNITSGEGGAVISEDDEVLRKVRDARLLGVEKDTEQRYKGLRSWEYEVSEQGYRYHMSNIFAAVGRTQLKRFDDELAPVRIARAKQYRARLQHVQGIALLDTDLGPVIPHIQPVRILGGRRDALRSFLERQGIQSGVHYKPNHLLRFYGGGKIPLPVTKALFEEIISLPLHPLLSSEDVDMICEKIDAYLNS